MSPIWWGRPLLDLHTKLHQSSINEVTTETVENRTVCGCQKRPLTGRQDYPLNGPYAAGAAPCANCWLVSIWNAYVKCAEGNQRECDHVTQETCLSFVIDDVFPKTLKDGIRTHVTQHASTKEHAKRTRPSILRAFMGACCDFLHLAAATARVYTEATEFY